MRAGSELRKQPPRLLRAEFGVQLPGGGGEVEALDALAERDVAGGQRIVAVGGDGAVAVEAAALSFMRDYVPQRISPMCGNSIGQDRRFMVRYMPLLEAWFHYRSIDVSTLKELCRRWKPDLAKGFVKKSDHTALTDIRESINELKYYREHFIKL